MQFSCVSSSVSCNFRKWVASKKVLRRKHKWKFSLCLSIVAQVLLLSHAEDVYVDVTFRSRSFVTFPPAATETELLAVLRTWQGSVASLSSLALQLSPTDGKVAGSMGPQRGFWQHRSHPGPVKEQHSGAQSRSALIAGQPSISHCQSQRSVKARRWVLHAQPMQWLIFPIQGANLGHFCPSCGRLRMATSPRLDDPSLMR